MGLAAYLVSSECDWDDYRAEYEEIVQLAEFLLSDRDRFSDEYSRTLSLDLGLIYPLHAVAWKCRYPGIRRRGIDPLLRSPQQEWLLDAQQYHAIFSRIMAIEEECLGLPADANAGKNDLPPEYARVHDFFCLPQPRPECDPTRYAVTFFTKPHGLDGAWHFNTEYMTLPSRVTSDLPPSNLISCRRWANSDTTDAQTSFELKAAVFGRHVLTKRPRPLVCQESGRSSAVDQQQCY
ncbi:uncharacterized protein BJX67DRAFT_386551 [Aspergillus lucknowensis]|uniref:Uncharacterized protein n=1 Tax=Aspergillus lucknowensis TaxID=176173 RepID=A0ABR4L5V1_9EURO